ncbi:flagellar protein FlgJ [Desulfacinum infernum DSM 9756]|jgi:flagellar protein FlgJ|uniref:Flagellar protein FlgJ n=1 Tax=Desulfacinum infernum DSM 9756 TaxID=1121391 RepID=A0A1M4UZF6_9BACT|nr:rod-binding protein [Desulfacinum infernum]MBC7357743.1 rod-binding protein [Desulfacinum sp.]SHE62062.1 flagellar protein FlgJ [Desulfacinum infernum DSM 9756]
MNVNALQIPPLGSDTESSGDPVRRQKEELRKACRDFESLLSAYLFKSMRSAVPRAEDPEHARTIYESLFDEALAQECAEQGSLGLGELLYRQLEPLIHEPGSPRKAKRA